MKITVDTSELKELEEKLSKETFNKALDVAMKELGARTLRAARMNTPHVSGNLRQGWADVERADHEMVRLVNPVKYAEYVEYGHRQEPGRFVPALADAKAPKGKRLKKSWVEGKFYAQRTEEQMRRQADRVVAPILAKELERLLND